MHLSARDLRRLEAAQHVLLAPLERSDLRTWQQRCNQAVRDVVGAAHTLFFFPRHDELVLFSEDTEQRALDGFLHLFERWEPGLMRVRDHAVNQANTVRQQHGSGVYHELMLGDRATLEGTSLYQEALAPAGVRHMIGLSAALPHGEASICIGFGTSPEIADQLIISPSTARRHTEQVLRKLGLKTRAAVALKLLQET